VNTVVLEEKTFAVTKKRNVLESLSTRERIDGENSYKERSSLSIHQGKGQRPETKTLERGEARKLVWDRALYQRKILGT